jgi:hypothetical protein
MLKSSGEPGKMIGAHGVDPRVGEANRVEHPSGELGDSGRRISLSRLERDGLRHHTAQPVEINDAIEFSPKTSRPGRKQNGILEGDSGDADARCP